MTDSSPVSDFSESELIARIARHLPQTEEIELGPGDDCAIVKAGDGRVLVSTDVLVEDRHFRLDWISAMDLGRRALAQNLADIAAMGARPTAIVVALTLPGHTRVAWLEELAQGMGEASSAAGASVAGGDLVRGEVVSIAVTVMGTMDGAAPVLRSGARPGDIVAHAGRIGWAAAGLDVLLAGLGGGAAKLEPFVRAHLVPEPPLRAGIAAREAGASAMLDVSDGFLRDAGRIAAASSVVLDIDQDAIERFALELGEAGKELGVDPSRWVLTGGEDHGLLATFPPDTKLPGAFTKIGSVKEPGSGAVVLISGQPVQLVPGWDHFSG